MAIERIELPNTANNVICEVRKEFRKVTLSFFTPEGEKLGTKSMISDVLNEDAVVDILAESKIEFTTFSALYQAASLIQKTADNLDSSKPSLFSEDKKIPTVEDKKSSTPEEESADSYVRPSERLKKEQAAENEDEYVPSFVTMEQDNAIEEKSKTMSSGFEIIDEPFEPVEFPFDASDLGQFLQLFQMPSSNNITVYFFSNDEFTQTRLVFLQQDHEIHREIIDGIPVEDDIYTFLHSSGVADYFVGMTALFDVTDKIIDVIKNAKTTMQDKITQDIDVSSSSAIEDEKTELEDISGTFLTAYKIPYSDYSIDFYLEDSEPVEMTAVFLMEKKEVYRTLISGEVSEDDAYNIVNTSGIAENFSSMSLIYDVAEKIIDVYTNPDKYQPKVEEISENITSGDIATASTVSDVDSTPSKVSTTPSAAELEFQEILESGVFLVEIKIPYSHDTTLKIYHKEESGRFALVFWRDGKQVDQNVTDKSLDEDSAWGIFNDADIEFISMSVIYDAVESLLDVLQNPEEYAKDESTYEETFIEEGQDAVVQKEEAAVDFDKFRGAEDIEPLMKAIKRTLGEANRPIEVKEDFIESMPKVGFKVYRRTIKRMKKKKEE